MTYEAWRISYQSSEQAARAAYAECARLQAKIEVMERQEPVMWVNSSNINSSRINKERGGRGDQHTCSETQTTYHDTQLYALPGAQPATSEQDESVRKSWARFRHELHRSPDAPYPGMADAFDQHFSQSFTDREWRAEASTWAAAWKAAKRHGAQPTPSMPEGFALVNAAHFLAVLDREDWRTAKNRAELRAMLAAAPKPEYG